MGDWSTSSTAPSDSHAGAFPRIVLDRLLRLVRLSASFTAGSNTPRINVLLPEPEMPEITLRRLIGKRASTFFRLCSEAPFQFQPRRIQRSARSAHRMRASGFQELARSANSCWPGFLERTAGDDFPAMAARTRTEIDDVVGPAHRSVVVLDDHQRVAVLRERLQRIEQP